jgi:uncharacterized membrane protein YfcA
MRVYWTLKSVPELADLSAKDRRAIWREAYREGSRYTFGEIALIALGAAVGAILGPLGAGLGVGIVFSADLFTHSRKAQATHDGD